MLYRKSSRGKIASCHFLYDTIIFSSSPLQRFYQAKALTCVNGWENCIFHRLNGNCTQLTPPSVDYFSAGLSIGHVYMDVNWHTGKIQMNRTPARQQQETLIPSHSNSLSIPGGSKLVHNALHRIDLNTVLRTYLSVTRFVCYRSSGQWKVEIRFV